MATTQLAITNAILDKLASLIASTTSPDELSNLINQQLTITNMIRDGYQFSDTDLLSLPDTLIAMFSERFDLYMSTIGDPSIYEIGLPGEIGFGVATCPPELLPNGWLATVGHDNKISANYGNYIDTNGSVLVYIPKHYFKYVGNNLFISSVPMTGFVLDRSFVNAGVEINGIFVYKYGGSNLAGKMVSKRFAPPLSTSSSHNPISVLSTAPANNYGGVYKAAKSAGVSYFSTPIFHYTMLARLALAHGKAATSTAACAFIDVNPKFPKGNLANALRDANDTNVTFTSDNYSNCALTGSGVPFAKTTHNGQECGVADLTGNMWEIASGFIRMDATGFLVLKESVDIRTITDDTTGATGAYNTALYDVLDLDDHAMSTTGAIVYFGNGTEQVFAMSTDRNANDYKRTAAGIPRALGVSGSGTTEFGNDYFYKYTRNEMACIVGGYWSNTSYAGVFAMDLYYYRTYSNYTVGCRASYLV